MMDILWQTAVIVASGITRSAHTFKLKIFEMRSTTCNGTALLTENKLHEFRPQTFFFVFVIYMARTGTLALPRNLCQFHEFLVQSQNIIGKNF